jgi:hypothetical protein
VNPKWRFAVIASLAHYVDYGNEITKCMYNMSRKEVIVVNNLESKVVHGKSMRNVEKYN